VTKCLPVYIGGATRQDEELYAATRALGGIGVMVTNPNDTCDGTGRSSEGSAATYTLSGPEELAQFLDLLVQSWLSSRSLSRYRNNNT
jgi:hypothetical protein